ncbi:hypothetical protein Tco_1276201 [Tanacetum coccineum]
MSGYLAIALTFQIILLNFALFPSYCFGTGMDFEEMLVGVFENIPARIDDIPELVGLRALNRRFRDILLSLTFAVAFNERDHPAPSWIMAQVFDEHNIHFGIHLCIEQIGAEERRTFQIPLVEIVSGVDVNFISLLAASGSLVLFRCVATEDESSYLIVLNLYNMGVVELDGLPPINFNADFGNWVHHVTPPNWVAAESMSGSATS